MSKWFSIGREQARTYGDGFDISELDISTFRQFCKAHKSAIVLHSKNLSTKLSEEQFNHIMWLDSFEKISEYLGNINYTGARGSLSGYGDIITNVIYSETGLRFIYDILYTEDREKAGDVIILQSGMPYDFNDFESKLTKEEFEKVLDTYATELNLSPME